ncbi:MAG: MCE family protein [Chitinophagales bacterium]|nr:MCE family protein [Hyphomicrobiales bacterium]
MPRGVAARASSGLKRSSGGFQQRALYRIEFRGSVAGLNTGAGVMSNGVRVGEVVKLELDMADPKRVEVTIVVASETAVRVDTRVGIDYQRLTGVSTISLTGGDAASAPFNRQGGAAPLQALRLAYCVRRRRLRQRRTL